MKSESPKHIFRHAKDVFWAFFMAVPYEAAARGKEP